ncbi:hypothetical protein GUJ93_ZPchr0010g7376 [Zizania palustris]|uniref:Uncharacterized protein n=1 Tax=Zizania palustris TaxID=103762 RepID=A0A8J5W998_ZIZPA|nr:hypothetical protein GUJ93_ZPchr0010g7376 [Zizania palustris]
MPQIKSQQFMVSSTQVNHDQRQLCSWAAGGRRPTRVVSDEPTKLVATQPPEVGTLMVIRGTGPTRLYLAVSSLASQLPNPVQVKRASATGWVWACLGCHRMA